MSLPRGSARFVAAIMFACAGVWSGAGCGRSPMPDEARTVVATLTADPASASPGGTVTLVVKFQMAPQWHLYGLGRNDSGYAPQVRLDLPAGWSAGALEWPAPERLLSAGDILDHVYHHELVLLQDVVVAPDARTGDRVRIGAQLRWLVCKDACVPGRDSLAVEVGIVGSGSPGPSAATQRLRGRLPQPLPDGLILTHWEAGAFHIRLAGSEPGQGARRLTFMPSDDCGELTHLIADGTGHELALRFAPRAGLTGPVRGLLLIEEETGPARPLHIDFPAVVATDTVHGGPS